MLRQWYGLSKVLTRVRGLARMGPQWPIRQRPWPNPGQLCLWGKVTPAQPAPHARVAEPGTAIPIQSLQEMTGYHFVERGCY